jgi:hypothetical protein
LAAASYYGGQSQRLGDEFLTELENTISRILANPEAWTEMANGARRCLMHRFPFGVVYEVADESVTIIAVMHLRRAPNYWLDRFER